MTNKKSTFDASRILNVIKSVSTPNPSTTTNLLHGVVLSVNPLSIKVDNRFIISEEFLILHAMCQEQIIKIPTESITKHIHQVPLHATDMGGSPAHNHQVQPFWTIDAMPEIRLWRGLQEGDNVRLLRINEGQTFYVLEREEGVPWYDVTAIANNK